MSFESLLNKTAQIWKRSVAQDATTGEMVESFALSYGSVKCRINLTAGDEYLGASRTLDRVTHKMFTVLNLNVDVLDQVKCEGKTYNILLVEDAGGQKHHKELYLEFVQ